MDDFSQKMDHVLKNDVELRRAILHPHLSVDNDQLQIACPGVYDRCKLCNGKKGGRFECTIQKWLFFGNTYTVFGMLYDF